MTATASTQSVARPSLDLLRSIQAANHAALCAARDAMLAAADAYHANPTPENQAARVAARAAFAAAMQRHTY